MEIELTKKEIKVILDLMGIGTTYLISHGQPEPKKEVSETLELVDVNKLEERLRRYLNSWVALKIHKSNDEEIIIGKFDERHRAINAINAARDIDLKDRKTCFNYIIESKF